MKKYLVTSSPIISFYLKILGSRRIVYDRKCKVTLGYIVSTSFGLFFSIFIIIVAIFSIMFLKTMGLGDFILIVILAIISYYVYSREMVENSEKMLDIINSVEKVGEAIFEANGLRAYFSRKEMVFVSRNPNIEKININYSVFGEKPLVKFLFNKDDIDEICYIFEKENIFSKLKNNGVEEIYLTEKNGMVIKVTAYKPALDKLVKNIIKLSLSINSREFIQRILKISIKNIGKINVDNIYNELLNIHSKIFLKSGKAVLENRIEKIMKTEKINRTSAIIKLWNLFGWE